VRLSAHLIIDEQPPAPNGDHHTLPDDQLLLEAWWIEVLNSTEQFEGGHERLATYMQDLSIKSNCFDRNKSADELREKKCTKELAFQSPNAEFAKAIEGRQVLWDRDGRNYSSPICRPRGLVPVTNIYQRRCQATHSLLHGTMINDEKFFRLLAAALTGHHSPAAVTMIWKYTSWLPAAPLVHLRATAEPSLTTFDIYPRPKGGRWSSGSVPWTPNS
jgi:hypothetical protein